MKKLLITLLLPLCSLVANAQNPDPIDRIYHRYGGEKVSIGLDLDAGFLENFDIDIDTHEVEQHMEGTIKRMRIVRFEDYYAALHSEKEIVEELLELGYESVHVPKDWHESDSQLLIFRLKGNKVSPHLIFIHNDRGSEDATILILSGSIIYKSKAL